MFKETMINALHCIWDCLVFLIYTCFFIAYIAPEMYRTVADDIYSQTQNATVSGDFAVIWTVFMYVFILLILKTVGKHFIKSDDKSNQEEIKIAAEVKAQSQTQNKSGDTLPGEA